MTLAALIAEAARLIEACRQECARLAESLGDREPTQQESIVADTETDGQAKAPDFDERLNKTMSRLFWEKVAVALVAIFLGAIVGWLVLTLFRAAIGTW